MKKETKKQRDKRANNWYEFIMNNTVLPDRYDPEVCDYDECYYVYMRELLQERKKHQAREAVYDLRQSLHERLAVLMRFAGKIGKRHKRRVLYYRKPCELGMKGWLWMDSSNRLVVELDNGHLVYVRTDGSMCGLPAALVGAPSSIYTPIINWCFPGDSKPAPWLDMTPPIKHYV